MVKDRKDILTEATKHTVVKDWSSDIKIDREYDEYVYLRILGRLWFGSNRAS